MQLADLQLHGIDLRGDDGRAVVHLSADSREVSPGTLFAALPGTVAHGERFIDAALAAGAVAVLGGPSLLALNLDVPVLIAEDPRRAWALVAARFAGRQPERIAAVTGTNGKTSTVTFACQLWRALGKSAASLGTLGVDRPSGFIPGSLTTPEPVCLHRLLADMAAEGVDRLAMEASSHGLDQRRLDGVELAVGAFLNITRDHLDYHGDFESYLKAKRRLFDVLLPAGATAVLNADAAFYPDLANAARTRSFDVLEFGRDATRFRLTGRRAMADGQELSLRLDGERFEVCLPVVGGFQAENLLAALAIVAATDGRIDEAVAAVPRLSGPRGRMELAGTHASGAGVFVDFAHTPDALKLALEALRPHCSGKLAVVVGCGGDRDKGKRPQMGRIAVTLADRVIVTDDNPRTEDAATVRAEVLAGCPGATEIGDRASAIASAIDALEPGDVLLIAGKGHETGQIVGDTVLPFDDVEVARRVLDSDKSEAGAAA